MQDDLPPALTLVIPGDALAVRGALRSLFDTILLRTLPDGARGTAEVVLAEALNNIVEHAYAASDGEIQITLAPTRQGLECLIVDQGRPMPSGGPPPGILPDPCAESPPEGGFGWHLIRTLSRDLHYRRADGRNHLSFRLGAD
ncbi:MAG: ATP-binding protein [Paracoccaceae bacterium]|nr:MAG: ATP-binding protein [Paracoccaceae bacterium]